MLEALIPNGRAQGAMTLVVSARVPDGIVTGADSLATLSVAAGGTVEGPVTCEHCGQEHTAALPIQLPPGLGTLSTLPYSLKVLPIYDYAAATFGESMIQRRSVFSLIGEFQREHPEPEPKPIEQVAADLGRWLHTRLADAIDVATIPEGSRALGFQLSGYRGADPLTIITSIGREVSHQELGDFGVTVSGETAVVTKLWELRQTLPEMGSAYQSWSVLDASEYVSFLIRLTADYQRFALMLPKVGGEIDIALVTPQGFEWIQRKKLADLLLYRKRSVVHDS